jgi:outer membrane immunogenic protein
MHGARTQRPQGSARIIRQERFSTLYGNVDAGMWQCSNGDCYVLVTFMFGVQKAPPRGSPPGRMQKEYKIMRTIAVAAFASASLLAAAVPAAAQDAAPFTGARIGATLGYDKVQGEDGLTYGGAFGYDVAVAPRITLGAEGTFEDSTTKGAGIRASRDVAISARAGYVLTPQLLGFAKVGYDTTRFELGGGHDNFEGVRFGGGLEYAMTPRTYVSAEYRRTEYEGNIGGRDAGVVGFGVRF